MRQSLWVVLAVVACVLFLGLAGGTFWFAWRLSARPPAPIVYAPAAHAKTPWRGSASARVDDDEPEVTVKKLPAVKRDVPVYAPRMLDGCSKADLDSVETGITDAIGIGAPLYNEGDFVGCYRTYDEAARAIEARVGKTCKGPTGALASGRARAASRATPSERAWAMRDEFDGLLDVIERKGTEL